MLNLRETEGELQYMECTGGHTKRPFLLNWFKLVQRNLVLFLWVVILISLEAPGKE